MAKQTYQSRWAARLDFASLRRRLSVLGIDASFYYSGDKQVRGLAPKALLCQRMCGTERHCQGFLKKLAEDCLEDPAIRHRSCLPGAFTVVSPPCRSNPEAPVVLGCFLTNSLGVSEELLRKASQLQLDHTALLSSVPAETRYEPENLALLAEMLGNITEDWRLCRSEETRELESLSRNLAETYEELSFIHKLNNEMNITANPREYFQKIAEDLCELLAVKAVLVVIFPEALASSEKQNSIMYSGPLPVSAERILESVYPRMLSEDGCIVRKDVTHCATYAATIDEIGQTLSAPILRNERRLGMISVLEPVDGRRFDNIDATRLSSVANSAAVFLENFRLYGSMRQLFLGSLRALTSSIDAKDPYTSGHSERVGLISKRLIELKGLGAREADRVYLCGLLHDIGKIGVPEAVLRKPGRLTDYEFEVINRHSTIGARIISGIQEMEDLIPAMLHHHERTDGGGYPDGLKADQIPFRARVLCVADCLDAMTSDRPYRRALPVKLAEAEIFRGAGTQFDPDLVELIPKLHLSEYLAELRKNKSSYVPDNIYEPISSPAKPTANPLE